MSPSLQGEPEKYKELGKLQIEADATLQRLRTELTSAIQSWAIFESSNGYPFAGSRSSLISKVNQQNESWGIQNIRLLAIRDTVLTLYRMTDHYDGARAANRQTLQRVRYFLGRQHCEEFLASEARNWLPGGWNADNDEKTVRKLYPLIVARLKEGKGAHPRNIMWLRNLLTDLRNNTLAHALDEKVEKLPRIYDIRDGLVLT